MLRGLGKSRILPPLCPVREAYGTFPTHTRPRNLYLDGDVSVVNSLAAPLLGSKN